MKALEAVGCDKENLAFKVEFTYDMQDLKLLDIEDHAVWKEEQCPVCVMQKRFQDEITVHAICSARQEPHQCHYSELEVCKAHYSASRMTAGQAKSGVISHIQSY